MKKTAIPVIALLIISLTFLLSGCIEIDISTGIDTDFTTYLSYRIAMDVSEFDELRQEILTNALHRIAWYYQEEHDFAVEVHKDASPIFITMTRRVKNNSLEQAFSSLEEMLTDEDITPFMQVDMEFYSSTRQNKYKIGAQMDIPQILRLSNEEEISPSLQRHLDEAIITGKGTVTLSLPAGELESSTHETSIRDNLAVTVIPLNFTDQTDFEMSAVINLLRDGTPGGSNDEIIRELTMYRNISIIVGCIAILLLIITFLVAKLAKR